MNEIVLKIALIFIGAMLFGLQRQWTKRPIGFGTFTFVATGSCVLAIISINLSPDHPGLLSGIITGVGFLGAGALVKTSDKIFGFTSAASIWVFATIGLAIGVGEYLGGAVLYASVWIIVGVDKILEVKGVGSYKKKMYITTRKLTDSEIVTKMLNDEIKDLKLVSHEVDKNKKSMNLLYVVGDDGNSINTAFDKLKKKDWVDRIKIE